MGPSLAGYGWVVGPVHTGLLPAKSAFSAKEKTLWIWFPAAETTSQAAVPMDPEAAQTLLGPMVSLGLGEN